MINIYYCKINYKDLNETCIKEKKNEKNKKIVTCLLCLEQGELDTFYNYNNNKYIHTCECTPNLHIKCFHEVYNKKNGNCIICQSKIMKNYCTTVDKNYSKIFFKYLFYMIVGYEFFYLVFLFIFNIDLNYYFVLN